MRVGPDQRVRVGQRSTIHGLAENDPGEILEVDLMDDARIGRDDAEVVERFLAPAKEGVALAIAAELEGGVQIRGVPFDIVIDRTE